MNHEAGRTTLKPSPAASHGDDHPADLPTRSPSRQTAGSLHRQASRQDGQHVEGRWKARVLGCSALAVDARKFAAQPRSAARGFVGADRARQDGGQGADALAGSVSRLPARLGAAAGADTVQTQNRAGDGKPYFACISIRRPHDGKSRENGFRARCCSIFNTS